MTRISGGIGPSSARRFTSSRREGPRQPEVEAAADVAHPAAGGLLGDGQRRDPEDDPLEGRRDRSRVGDVVAEVGAVVDPGDDQVGAAAEQAELGEADAVDRRAVGREAAVAVAELDLLDRQRRAGRDAPRGRAAVGIGSDHVDLDAVELAQGPARGLQARGGDSVVVGQKDPHRADFRLRCILLAVATVRLDIEYDGSGFSGWAQAARPADRPGRAGDGAGDDPRAAPRSS